MKKVTNFLKGSAFGVIIVLAVHLPAADVEGEERAIVPTSSFFAPLEVTMPVVETDRYTAQPTVVEATPIVLVKSLEQQKKQSLLEVSTMSAAVTHAPTAAPTIAPTRIPVPTEPPVLIAAASVIPYDEHFIKYAALYNVDKDTLVGIARCESGFRAGAVNGPYLGMFQYLASTWSSTRSAMGENPDPALRANPEEAIKTSAWKIANGGRGAWPHCGA